MEGLAWALPAEGKKQSHPRKGASTNLIKAPAGRRENQLFGKKKTAHNLLSLEK